MKRQLRQQIEMARALFRKFHGREATSSEIIKVGGLSKPIIALEVGRFLAVGYRSVGKAEKFYHEFSGTLPRIFVSFDGRQIFVLNGDYKFTDRGFVG